MVVKEETISVEMNQEKTNSSKMLPHRDQMNRPKKYFCEICETFEKIPALPWLRLPSFTI